MDRDSFSIHTAKSKFPFSGNIIIVPSGNSGAVTSSTAGEQWILSAPTPPRIQSLNKPDLISLDEFYRLELPSLIHQRNPNPHVTTPELTKLKRWRISGGKWRQRLLDYVSSLDEALLKSASQNAFEALPDVSKAVSELTVLKGVGPATASAVLAAYAPDFAPFMSDEAMVAALGSSKEYTLKQYLLFVKLCTKAKDLSSHGESFSPSEVERALWSSAIGAKLPASQPDTTSNTNTTSGSKRRRKS